MVPNGYFMYEVFMVPNVNFLKEIFLIQDMIGMLRSNLGTFIHPRVHTEKRVDKIPAA